MNFFAYRNFEPTVCYMIAWISGSFIFRVRSHVVPRLSSIGNVKQPNNSVIYMNRCTRVKSIDIPQLKDGLSE